METEQKNETNQAITGVAIHDIVILSKYQKTSPSGKKLGYSFYEKDQIGVVVQVNEDKLVIKLADGDTETYNVQDEDKEYYYRIGKGSEVEYAAEIRKAILKQEEKVDKEIEKCEELEKWEKEFNHSISFIGRMARFVKEFNK